jgi:hypothetical protein
MKLVWLTLALGATLAGMNHADASDTPAAKTAADQAASDDPTTPGCGSKTSTVSARWTG